MFIKYSMDLFVYNKRHAPTCLTRANSYRYTGLFG